MLPMNRRHFLGGVAASAVSQPVPEPLIDIHQHTDYAGRPDDVLLRHQQTMGVTKTILLPAGSDYGLEVRASSNERCLEVARRYPERFAFFANEVPYFPNARQVIETYLKQGAIGIGEQKFFVDVLGAPMALLCDIAQHFDVPILLHFQYERYNVNFDQFWRILARYPKVNFIGHAQTMWANIDANQRLEPSALYPRGKVTPGGLTDRYLRDYPNMFADLSAGSGLNALRRDEEHARAFLLRHQDKLLYGSDCDDHVGTGAKCSGAGQIAMVRKLAPPAVQKKIFYENARRIMRL